MLPLTQCAVLNRSCTSPWRFRGEHYLELVARDESPTKNQRRDFSSRGIWPGNMEDFLHKLRKKDRCLCLFVER